MLMQNRLYHRYVIRFRKTSRVLFVNSISMLAPFGAYFRQIENTIRYDKLHMTPRVKDRLRAKTKIVRHHEAKLRHEEGSVKLREESVSDKLLTLERRTKVSLKLGNVEINVMSN